MIVSNQFDQCANIDHQLIMDYSLINQRNNELQIICNSEGKILLWSSNQEFENWITAKTSSIQNISALFQNCSNLIEKTKGCVIRTTLNPYSLLKNALEHFGFVSTHLKVQLFPIFYSEVTNECVCLTLQLSSNEKVKHQKSRAKCYPSTIAYGLIDTQTGLVIENNDTFSDLIGFSKTTLETARCDEMGLKDLLLLATLNADRRCYFPTQLNQSDSKSYFVLSEAIQIGNRDCIRVLIPPQPATRQTTSSLSNELSHALLESWKNKPNKVLICDDNDLLLDTCSSIMRWAGIHYKLAKNGKEALTLLEKESFDVILLDLNMPLLNGFDTAKIIKKSNKTYAVTPLIAMTATPLNGVGYQSQLKHFDSILKKPFDTEDIRQAIKSGIDRVNSMKDQNLKITDSHQSINIPPLSQYSPTSFMIQFRNNEKRIENLRKSILNELNKIQKRTSELHHQRQHKSYLETLQQAQSMSVSIGANQLAKTIHQLHQEYKTAYQAKKNELHEHLMEALDETQIFYNHVDWKQFIPENTSNKIHVAA